MLKIKLSMHFVLQKLSSLNKRPTEDLDISNSSEMMSALLIVVVVVFICVTLQLMILIKAACQQQAE